MENISGNVKKLGKNFILFGIGYYTPAIVNIILIPLYVRYISPSDYGVLALLAGFGAILTIIMEFCVNRSIERFYIDYPPKERKEFLCSTIIAIFLYAGFLGIALSLFAPRLMHIFFETNLSRYSYYLILQIWVSFFLVFPRAVSAVYIIKEKSVYYTLFRILDFLVLILTTILFLVILKRGLGGIIEAIFISAAIMAVFYTTLLIPEIKLSFKIEYIKRFLGYSLPLLPYKIFLILIAYVDRFYINHFFSLEDVAIYSIGSRFSMIMEVVVSSFAIAWQPFYYNRIGKDDSDIVFGKIATGWMALIVLAAISISIFAREIVIIFTSPAYYAAYGIIPILVLGHIFLSFYFFPLASLFYLNRTKLMPLHSGIALICNILFIQLIGHHLGIVGPALSKTIAYFLMWALTQYYAFSVLDVRYEYKKLLKILASGIIVFIIGFNISFSSIAFNIALKAVLVILYLFILNKFGILDLLKIRKIWLKEKIEKSIATVEDMSESV